MASSSTSADMPASGSKKKDPLTSSSEAAKGSTKGSTNATKGWAELLGDKENGRKEIGWCIVHLYREGEGVDGNTGPAKNIRPKASIVEASTNTISTPPQQSSLLGGGSGGIVDEERTLEMPPEHKAHGGQVSASSTSSTTTITEESSILCIPSVPSHITPSDFLSWVGPDTMNKVSHFRMVLTGQPTRYLVLIKFREAKNARWWRKLWDGRRFDSGGGVDDEEETASVLFVRRVKFETPTVDTSNSAKKKEASENGSEKSYGSSSERSFPDMTHDPFTPSKDPPATSAALNMSGNGNGTNSTLSELPTCPVCLERMDVDPSDPSANFGGLLTILCQHVFHCACLQKWRGSGCPVCRHTQNKSPPLRTYSGQQGRAPFGRNPGEAEACSVCGCEEDLWICLVCGNVGCGRYKGGHAKRHWQDSQQSNDYHGMENAVGSHNYALEVETQHVWDYVGDKWVHRLIMDQGDRKLASTDDEDGAGTGERERERIHEDMEMVPKEKLETIGLEYTHLLTSSLDSQRLYFEDILSKTKTANTSAALLENQVNDLQSQILSLTAELQSLRTETIPQLEKERDRAVAKSEKSADLARGLAKSLGEEREVSKGLMKRIEHVNTSMASMAKEMGGLRGEVEDLKEQNRDLSFFISSGEKIEGLEGELGEEVREGTVSVPLAPPEKGKGRAKKK